MDTQAEILALQHRQLVTYFYVSDSALYLLDYLLTLGEEVELIWHAKWNITKILYLLSRYLPFVDIAVAIWPQVTPNMNPDHCLVAFKINTSMIVVGMLFAEALLTLRTWVVWNRRRCLTIAMSATFVALVISALVVLVLFCRSMQSATPTNADPKGCFLSVDGAIVLWIFALLALYEIVMFLLMAVKAYQQFVREAPVGSSQLLNAILKDGLLYYLYIAGICVLNMVLTFKLSRDLLILLALEKRTIHSILTCRTITNIRARAKKQVIIGSSGPIEELGTVSSFQVVSQTNSRGLDD